MLLIFCFINHIDGQIIFLHVAGICIKIGLTYIGSYYLSFSLNPI